MSRRTPARCRTAGRPSLKHRPKSLGDAFNPVGANKTSQPPACHDLVESWLEHIAGQDRRPGEVIGRSPSPESRHAASPYDRRSRHAEPRWSSRHAFPIRDLRQSRSPIRGSCLGNPGNRTRRRPAPSDSSFISGFENYSQPPPRGPGPAQRSYGNISPAGQLGDSGLDASSVASPVDNAENFEKRPRRKTREDRYELGKGRKRRRRERESAKGRDDCRGKRRKRSQKKQMMSSKDVVKNFTSDAVLHDRITVPPHLKPGLFENGRTSKKQPLSDLAFSGMQFLKHPEGNLRLKSLSRSRLQEKRREGREMEQVSSFFLPLRATENTRRPRSREHDTPGGSSSPQCQPMHYKCHYSPSSSDRRETFERHHPLQAYRDQSMGAPSLRSRRSIDGEKTSRRNTTCFTWSNSRRTPLENEDELSSRQSDSAWTTTPEPIRKDIIATGIYQNTGIPLYDGRLGGRGTGRMDTDNKKPDTYLTGQGGGRRQPDNTPHSYPKVKYKDQAVMTDDRLKHMEQAKERIHSPERGLEREVLSSPGFRTTKESQVARNRDGSNLQSPHINQEVGGLRLVGEVHARPVVVGSPKRSAQVQNKPSVEAIVGCQGRAEVSKEPAANPVIPDQELDERISVASKDAMPPPPVPPGRNNSVATARGNGGETGQCSQNRHSANATLKVQSAPDGVGHDNTAQYDQETDQDCNTDAPVSERANATKQTLPSLSTASWIPHRTPSAQIMEMRRLPSGQGVKSPIHVDQLEEKLSEISRGRATSSTPLASQCMTESSARLGGESPSRSPPSDYEPPRSESRSDKAALDCHSIYGTPNDQRPAYGMDEETAPSSIRDLHIEHPGLRGWGASHRRTGHVRTNACCHKFETSTPGVGMMRLPEDPEEERSEMLSFWRPNRFLRF
ncbi:hypothetical protein GGS23DRAFT_270399 [Durotheca rogersii]|uniref:uncharacterized protein n=1 Tax=Durotheca rogersii TaxID=419775 RepID=UPI0022200B4C|nr:uncharacterized protein GGS23DRAFT_270399 [Durotheca rogersii]KAI5866429.1 hypothetical protein GGS23DRAFT_270399 [Durotheca rogersii]